MNRALMDEQEWEYNESLRINQEKEEQFLREAFAIPAKEPTAKKTEDFKEETKEEAKLTLNELRKARLQFYEKKIDLKKES